MTLEQPLHVTLIALHAHALISRSAASATIGGIQTRSWTLARQLRRLGLKVTYIVNQIELEPRQVVEDVEVLAKPLAGPKSPALRAWIALTAGTTKLQRMFPLLGWIRRGFRPPPPPGPALWQAVPDPFITQAPGRVLVCFGVNTHNATFIQSARASGRPAVLMLASDGDLSEDYVLGSTKPNFYGDQAHTCAWALHHADVVVAQTLRQRELLRTRFGRDAVVLPNPIDLEEWHAGESRELPFDVQHGYMLWVGRADRIKQPTLLVELARRCPSVRFVLIMNPNQEAVEKQVREALPANVTLVPWVDFEQMPAVFRHATVLVNTSQFEGLPNTFLQAGASGKPVASLQVDPGLLQASGGGLVASGSLDQLASDVIRLHEDPALAAAMGQRLRDHVEQHHSLDVIGQQFAALLAEAAQSSQQTAAAAR